MKKLVIDKEHRLLLESIVKENPRFKNNENLLDEFVDTIYSKSYLLIGAIKDMSRLRRHLLIIAESAMDAVLKEKKAQEEDYLYKKIELDSKKRQNIVSLKTNFAKEFNINEEYKKSQIINLKEEIHKTEKFVGSNELDDPLDSIIEEQVPMDTIDKLVHIIKIIDSKDKNKKYYEIFTLRYLEKYPQSEIASVIGISQVELSKRFVELIKQIKEFV